MFTGSTRERKIHQRAEHFFATISKWPSGKCAAKTIGSVKLLKWGLERVKKSLNELGYDATNLLSCMTLDVENLHSVVHHKSKVSAALQYVRDFGSTAKESPKRKIAWSAYYYTSCWSWYPVPEGALGLFEILSMSQASVVKASKDEISMMREWATAHGSSVGQRTVRQETTMARAGTLPDFLYQKEIEVGERIDLSSNSVATTDISSVSSITDAEDEVTEYDSSSDEEICEAEDLV